MKKYLALVLSCLMLVCALASCNLFNKGKDDKKEQKYPLVVGYDEFNEKFSPFFSETAYDQDVYAMTALGLLNSTRTGAIVQKGIKGEVENYNGTDYTYYGPADLTIKEEGGQYIYEFVLKDGLKFSDGKPVTIDDVIFSMYVLSDPTYDGSSTFFALPILGMNEYRAGMDSKWKLIYAAGEGAEPSEYFTAAEAEEFWGKFESVATAYAESIINYIRVNYGAAYGVETVAECAALWGYELDAAAEYADFGAALLDAYGKDLDGLDLEAGSSTFTSLLIEALDPAFSAGIKVGNSADKIEGIKRVNNNTLQVILTEADATAIYQLGVVIAPKHYYGNGSYDYAKNNFGFPKGDLSSVKAKTTVPMGAGPYKFVEYKDNVVYFEANENYYLGAPKTQKVQFKVASQDDKLNGVITGGLDITDPSFSTDAIDAIKKANGGELNGAKVTVNTVNNLGYGYIGISANLANVEGNPGSNASKNFRKAIATVLAVYRDLSVSSYYGDRASVINYPISDTSWAAPRPSDEGYEVAFSKDANGNAIYTAGMSEEQKYAAALNAAVTFFKAAGFTFDDAGKIATAPNGPDGKPLLGLKLEIPADGKGDHPAYTVVTKAQEALKTIGFDLNVQDLANSSQLWDDIEAETLPMWAAAWGATVDPDMYQIYFSGETGKEPGGSNYMYDIDDAQLNKLILDARKSLVQEDRKVMYKECLDIVVDWAVEIPVYQRQNCIIFSTERVNLDTVTPDITTFYGWMAEIEKLEMKGN